MKKSRTDFWFIFWGSFIFLTTVWFLNLSQYLVVIAFLLYIGAVSLYVNNIALGLALGALVAFCIQTGKTYTFLMLSPGMVSPERFPEGYSISVSLTVNHIISILLACFIAHGVFTKKYNDVKIILLDLLIFGFFFWVWLTALFGSNMPEISTLYAILSLSILIKYVFFRLHSSLIHKHRRVIFTIITAMLLFESVVAIIQYMYGSPLAKSIESQKYFEIFGGGATDEMEFVFRPLGTFRHTNYLAGFIALVAPVVVALSFWKKNVLYFRIYLTALIASGLTLSRGGWIALLPHGVMFYSQIISASQRVMLKMGLWSKIILSSILLTLFFVVVFPRLIKSLNIYSSDISNGLGVRLAQTENAMRLISLNPLFGVGAGMSVIEGYNLEPDGVMWSFPSPIHNIFALILVENGIPGLILYISMLSYMLFKLWASINPRRKETTMIRGLCCTIIAACIIGLIQPYDFLELILLLSLIYI